MRKTDIKETVFFMIKLVVKYNTFRGTGFPVPSYGTERYKISKEKDFSGNRILNTGETECLASTTSIKVPLYPHHD